MAFFFDDFNWSYLHFQTGYAFEDNSKMIRIKSEMRRSKLFYVIQ